MSDSIIHLYTAPRTPEKTFELSEHAPPASNRKAVVFRGRSASDASKDKTPPERPPRPRYGLLESLASAGKVASSLPDSPQAETSLPADVMAEILRQSSEQHASIAQQSQDEQKPNPFSLTDTQERAINPTLRPRAGSVGSNTSHLPIQHAPSSERQPSVSSGSNIPFVIAMGSPHNPALITPTTSVPPTACSITRNAPLTINSSISRTGVGGTMASSTPVTSPVATTGGPMLELTPKASSNTVPATSAAPTRRPSLNKKQDDQGPRTPRTPSHSRNVSSSSIRTAIRLPKNREKDREEAHKMRKDSISMPRPLGSSFGVPRTASTAPEDKGDGEKNRMNEYTTAVVEMI